ncbi:MAG: BrnT family toxin [Caulobacterales bacterium]
MRWYAWDPAKAASNRTKHGVSFEVAVKVFDDPNALTAFDQGEHGDNRWRTLGGVAGSLLLVVVHTEEEDDGDEIVRIISARRANRQERIDHETALSARHRR